MIEKYVFFLELETLSVLLLIYIVYKEDLPCSVGVTSFESIVLIAGRNRMENMVNAHAVKKKTTENSIYYFDQN